MIVSSCFDEPLKRISDHFGDAAVLLTGATPAGQRQQLVDRFQNDDTARVFVANILAGGVGINLTAARQVIFNDLDWVPANHWQAEDRAYRIGQTNTVHVTYMSAAGTVDEFVETLLQAKAALVGAVVDGEALEEAGVGDSVLEELQRLLARMSPQIADFGTGSLDTAQVSRLLRDLARDAAADRRATARGAGARPGQGSAGTQSEAMQAALRLLEQALAGAQVTRYRVASSSRPDQHYDLEVAAGGEVTCGCPGFGYRGQCSHGRSLKSALARRGTPPQGFTAVGMAPA